MRPDAPDFAAQTMVEAMEDDEWLDQQEQDMEQREEERTCVQPYWPIFGARHFHSHSMVCCSLLMLGTMQGTGLPAPRPAIIAQVADVLPDKSEAEIARAVRFGLVSLHSSRVLTLEALASASCFGFESESPSPST